MSNSHAKSALILGHLNSEAGERIHSLKIIDLFQRDGGYTFSTLDLIELFGEIYEPLAQLNYELASSGLSLIEAMELQEISKILKKITDIPADLIIVLSWCWSLAALFATGIQKLRKTVVKFQVHHHDERILVPLYEPAHLLITESLLANQRGIEYGIPSSKILYFPHTYPENCEMIRGDRRYIHALAKNGGKTIRKSTCIIGMISRLEYGKNCEFGIETVRQLAQEGGNVVLYLKGDLPFETSYPNYRKNLNEMLHTYQSEPWLIWDRSQTPFPQVLSLYQACDFFLQLSGAEAGSHTMVELLGLGKPVITLGVSTQPSLFRGGVSFIKPTLERKNALVPFFLPDLHELKEKVMELVRDKKAREELGKRAKMTAIARFHPSIAQKRLSLIFESSKNKIEETYKRDLEAYGL